MGEPTQSSRNMPSRFHSRLNDSLTVNVPRTEIPGDLITCCRLKNATYITQSQACEMLEAADNGKCTQYELRFLDNGVGLCKQGKRKPSKMMNYEDIVQVAKVPTDRRVVMLHHKKGKHSAVYIMRMMCSSQVKCVEQAVFGRNRGIITWSTSVDEVYEEKREMAKKRARDALEYS